MSKKSKKENGDLDGIPAKSKKKWTKKDFESITKRVGNFPIIHAGKAVL
jgi:hypothetical protein